MGHGHSQRWGNWSEWTFHNDYQRHYRVRQDANGELDYEWDQAQQSREPRSEPEIDGLTEAMNNLGQSPGKSKRYAHTNAEADKSTKKSHKSDRRGGTSESIQQRAASSIHDDQPSRAPAQPIDENLAYAYTQEPQPQYTQQGSSGGGRRHAYRGPQSTGSVQSQDLSYDSEQYGHTQGQHNRQAGYAQGQHNQQAGHPQDGYVQQAGHAQAQYAQQAGYIQAQYGQEPGRSTEYGSRESYDRPVESERHRKHGKHEKYDKHSHGKREERSKYEKSSSSKHSKTATYDHPASTAYDQPSASTYAHPSAAYNPASASAYGQSPTSTYDQASPSGHGRASSSTYNQPPAFAYDQPSTSGYDRTSTAGYDQQSTAASDQPSSAGYDQPSTSATEIPSSAYDQPATSEYSQSASAYNQPAASAYDTNQPAAASTQPRTSSHDISASSAQETQGHQYPDHQSAASHPYSDYQGQSSATYGHQPAYEKKDKHSRHEKVDKSARGYQDESAAGTAYEGAAYYDSHKGKHPEKTRHDRHGKSKRHDKHGREREAVYDERGQNILSPESQQGYPEQQIYDQQPVAPDERQPYEPYAPAEYPQDRPGETSTAGYEYPYGNEPAQAGPSTHTQRSSTSQPYPYEQQRRANDFASSKRANYLDSHYSIVPSYEFRPGTIFKMYWSEPKGGSSHGSKKNENVSKDSLGNFVYSCFRRFIVIATDQGHSTCVPVLTYEGRACAKKGVKADRHGILYDQRNGYGLVDKEPALGFSPVRAVMTVETETLSMESRVNYSKPSTIEHNTPVWFIGKVHEADWETVLFAYDSCWRRKSRNH